jgi:NADH-quinone oxidoreductase subunit C
MTLDLNYIKEQLTSKFGNEVSEFDEAHGIISFRVAPLKNLEVVQYLFKTEELAFQFLTDITAIHYPERKGEELCIVTHLHNLVANVRLKIKAYVDIQQPDTYSLVPQFLGANWMERETFDFYGINFIGHPNLTRILNADEMDYHPMRKEYPMEDPTRVDKDDEMFGRGGTF